MKTRIITELFQYEWNMVSCSMHIQRHINTAAPTQKRLTVFTVTWQDVQDYLRCPKIVAVKAHNSLRTPTPARTTAKRSGSITHEIGLAGEIATRHMLAGAESGYAPSELRGGHLGSSDSRDDHAKRISRMKIDLEKHGVALNGAVRGILKDTIEGMDKIRRQIGDRYGEISIIGRGESRNGLLLSTSKPDFIALAGDQKKLVLVEVKNTEVASTTAHKFQAQFYNTVGTKFGITIMETYGQPDLVKMAPMTTRHKTSETILVYPRHGKFEVIKDKVSVNKEMVHGIWRAKQLGMKGKSPRTDCDSICPHHRYCRLPEGNIEVAVPLPLAYSRGRVEHGVDLNALYWKRFLSSSGIMGIRSRFRTDFLHEKIEIKWIADPVERESRLGNLEKSRQDFEDAIVERTGIEEKWFHGRAYLKSGGTETDKDIERDMPNELEAWKKILGAGRLKSGKVNAKKQATRIYPLPQGSARFVKKSWDEWV